VFALGTYSAAIFLGSPLLLGAVGAFLFNRQEHASFGKTLSVTFLSLLLFAGLLLVLAFEGAVCIAMALPLACLLAIPGALVGWTIAQRTSVPASHAGYALLALPALAGIEGTQDQSFGGEVVTTVEIDAPADVVWEHVVSFSELPAPNRLVFELGIAYPVRAVIDGVGVGAVRRCEFSTGAFVEPITHWEPGRRLAFDVAEQPPPMEEWSFYAEIDAPHLDGYLRCLRGEFRLVPLGDGRTRLEGSTWYELDMQPGPYWKLWTDALLHSIHERVLEHIAREAERSRR